MVNQPKHPRGIGKSYRSALFIAEVIARGGKVYHCSPDPDKCGMIVDVNVPTRHAMQKQLTHFIMPTHQLLKRRPHEPEFEIIFEGSKKACQTEYAYERRRDRSAVLSVKPYGATK